MLILLALCLSHISLNYSFPWEYSLAILLSIPITTMLRLSSTQAERIPIVSLSPCFSLPIPSLPVEKLIL